MAITIAHPPAVAPDAQTPPPDTTLGWTRLGPDMPTRYVILQRGLSTGATDPGGYWAGPEDPDRYYDCLATLNMRTRHRLDYAPVATFADPGTAWSIWHRHHGHHLGHGWALHITRLADIGDWTRLPPTRHTISREMR